MQLYLTYQHNVQRLFRDHVDKYDGVLIPLSIATSFPTGTYGFIRALCSAHSDKHYAIDPRNVLFQKSWNRDNVRKPHEKMVNALGEPYISNALVRPLEPTDFADDGILEAHVRQCIRVQQDFGTRTEDARKLEKYKTLLGVADLGTLGVPQFLIPPYYQFQTTDDPWYEVSRRCIVAALKHHGRIPIWPVLHFQDWSGVEWDVCYKWLADAGLHEMWLYPNFFKEHEASLDALKGYRSCVEDAAKHVLVPYSLFGGYYAVLMSYFGLGGVGNGIGYGEWRDSGYHRGGTAATRVYLLKLHRYVDAPAAQHLVDRDREYFGNDSEISAGYVEAGVSLAEMTLAESLDHFLECRRQELEFVAAQPLSSAAEELEQTQERLKAIGPLEYQEYGRSLERWQQALS